MPGVSLQLLRETPNCHKLAATTWWTAENQGALIVAVIPPSPRCCKGHLDFARCSDSWPSEQGAEPYPPPRYGHSGKGRGVRRGTRPIIIPALHHLTASLNLICIFSLNARPQPHSVHSLGQLSLTVL